MLKAEAEWLDWAGFHGSQKMNPSKFCFPFPYPPVTTLGLCLSQMSKQLGTKFDTPINVPIRMNQSLWSSCNCHLAPSSAQNFHFSNTLLIRSASRRLDVCVHLHRWRLDVRGVVHVRTLDCHTLEASVGVHTHLLSCAGVHPVLTLVDVWTEQKPVSQTTTCSSNWKMTFELWPVQLRPSLARS